MRPRGAPQHEGVLDGIKKIPHPEEAAKRPSRRTKIADPASRRFPCRLLRSRGGRPNVGEPLMSEAGNLFTALRQSADPGAAAAIEQLVRDAPDRALSRVNVLDFAAKSGIEVESAIAAFLHAARLGIFELSWNVLCPGCGGVLGASTTLRSVNHSEYYCAMCASGYEPTLDEMVEVTFTVSRRVRRIAAHDPDELPFVEYFRQIFWGSGFDVPDNVEELIEEIVLDQIELPPGEKALLSLQLPAEFVIIMDPVTHGAQFLDVKGEPTRERQNLSLVFDKLRAPTGTMTNNP